MNIVATKIIIIIIIYASMNDTAFLLDFAIIYALSGFIGTIYIALFFADRRKKKEGE
jgi:multisubunit Na+/H+ antiporter MnhF subunit